MSLLHSIIIVNHRRHKFSKFNSYYTKRRFLDVIKEAMEEVGAKETDIEDRKMWRMMIRLWPPLTKRKGRKEKKKKNSYYTILSAD